MPGNWHSTAENIAMCMPRRACWSTCWRFAMINLSWSLMLSRMRSTVAKSTELEPKGWKSSRGVHAQGNWKDCFLSIWNGCLYESFDRMPWELAGAGRGLRPRGSWEWCCCWLMINVIGWPLRSQPFALRCHFHRQANSQLQSFTCAGPLQWTWVKPIAGVFYRWELMSGVLLFCLSTVLLGAICLCTGVFLFCLCAFHQLFRLGNCFKPGLFAQLLQASKLGLILSSAHPTTLWTDWQHKGCHKAAGC